MRTHPVRPGVGIVLACIVLNGGFIKLATARAQDDPEHTVKDFIAKADQARNDDYFEIELAHLSRARQVDSLNAAVLWRLTRIYVELGQLAEKKSQKRRHYEAALAHGQQAILADSMDYLSYTWLAIAEGTLASVEGFKRRIQLAWSIREHALRAIELNPSYDVPYHVMGRWHLEIASIGGLKRTMANLFFGKLPEASYEQAIYYLEQAILKNDNIHHRLVRVRAYLKSDQKERARSELQHILIMEGHKRLDDKFRNEAKLMLAELQ